MPQILIEDWRTTHRTRWNKQRAAKSFQIGDVVKSHAQVQFNAFTGAVKKLSYQARCPFQIKEILDADSYLIQRYNEFNSATSKYKGSVLYLLTPSIFPHNSVDTMDQRYLNFSNSPIDSPLKRPLQINLYNGTYFTPDYSYT